MNADGPGGATRRRGRHAPRERVQRPRAIGGRRHEVVLPGEATVKPFDIFDEATRGRATLRRSPAGSMTAWRLRAHEPNLPCSVPDRQLGVGLRRVAGDIPGANAQPVASVWEASRVPVRRLEDAEPIDAAAADVAVPAHAAICG